MSSNLTGREKICFAPGFCRGWSSDATTKVQMYCVGSVSPELHNNTHFLLGTLQTDFSNALSLVQSVCLEMHDFVTMVSLICHWIIKIYVWLLFFNISIDILNLLTEMAFVESRPKHNRFLKPSINLPVFYGTHLNVIELFLTICSIV